MRADNIIDFIRPTQSDDGKLTAYSGYNSNCSETKFDSVMEQVTEQKVFSEIKEENYNVEPKENVKEKKSDKKDVSSNTADNILTLMAYQKNFLEIKEEKTKNKRKDIRFVIGIEVKEKEKNNVVPYIKKDAENESISNIKAQKQENKKEITSQKNLKNNEKNIQNNENNEKNEKSLVAKPKEDNSENNIKDGLKFNSSFDVKSLKNPTNSISLTGEADSKLARRIESILRDRIDASKNNNQFDIKLALRPDTLGRIVLKVSFDPETRMMQIDLRGDEKAMNALKTGSVISDSIKNLGITVSGISFAKETDEERNRDKSEKDKKRDGGADSKKKNRIISFFK